MAGDETKDMERIPLYKTETAKRAIEGRWNHFMRALNYLAEYINGGKTGPNIDEIKDNLLDLQISMENKLSSLMSDANSPSEKQELSENLVYGAFINMAEMAQKNLEKKKKSVQEMPAISETKDIQAHKLRAKITGVKGFTATPISEAKKKRESSI